MNLRDFRTANLARCEEAFHPVNSWSPTDWATAMMGEAGEACNLIKKLHRGDFDDEGSLKEPLMAIALNEIADELADMVTYADLLAARLGIDLEGALIRKFNKVSARVGSDIMLPPLEEPPLPYPEHP